MLRVSERVEIARPLYHAGEQRGFGQGDFMKWLSEKYSRGLAESPNVIRSLATEKNLVHIRFKDFLLRPFVLEVDRHHGFGELSTPAFVRLEPEPADKLHCQRRGSLCFPPISKIDPTGLHDAGKVEPSVLKKMLVFGRDDGTDQDWGNLGEFDEPALLPAGVQCGEQRIAQIKISELTSGRLDRLDCSVADQHRETPPGSAV